MHKVVVLFTFLFSLTCSFTQEDTTSRKLDKVEVISKSAGFKKIGLYDDMPEEEYNIRGFTQLSIFENDLTDEFWMSKGLRCVSSQLEQEGNDSYINLKWNKDLDGCDWVGIGFGWDGWTGKDMAYVVDTLAIELQVRSTGKPFTNLPWAFGIEDYSGQQAWLGYNISFLQGENISQDWTNVQIPLSLFPFVENDVDLTSVKQLLIQVFAEGVIEIKRVHLVPFSKKLKKEVQASRLAKLPAAGAFNNGLENYTDIDGGHSFAVSYNEDSLFFAFNIKDETPRNNQHKEGNLWKGDAIEVTFSTNTLANPKRKFLLLSDQHIGVNCGQTPYVWDWKESVKRESIAYQFKETEDGYHVEIAIPFTQLYNVKLSSGLELDLEVAIDLNEGDDRKEQNRWNSTFEEGFNTSPTKWGVLILE
ncbi:hypothetical protein N8987_03375 [Crocinitomix sp.]|nr:hypothetical protein [Crocinitomix sp.]